MKCWCPMSYATSSDSTVPRHLLSCVGVFGFPYSAGMPKMNLRDRPCAWLLLRPTYE